jgi:hypothetical protein
VKIRWRQGLGAASAAERAAIIYAEHIGRQDSVTSICAERCSQHPVGLAECGDVSIMSSRVKWCRHRGSLLVVVVVYTLPGLRRHEYRFRCDKNTQRKVMLQAMLTVPMESGETSV